MNLSHPADRPEPGRSFVLRRRRVAQHLRLPRQDKEGPRAARDVLRLQVGRRVPVQGKAAAEEETHGELVSVSLPCGRIRLCGDFNKADLSIIFRVFREFRPRLTPAR